MTDKSTAESRSISDKDSRATITSAAERLAREPDDVVAFLALCAAATAHPAFHEQLRNSVAMRNPGIAALQSNPAIFPGSVSPEMGQFLYSLVTILRPKTILETGSLFGYSTMCMAQAAKDNGHGHVHSIDLFPAENYSKVTDATGDDRGLNFVQDHLTRGGVSDIVTLHRGDSAKMIDDLARTNDSFKIDFAFIDGDHFMAGAKRDFVAVDKHLATGGIIVLHDTNPKECGWMGPRFVAENLRDSGGYNVLNLNTADTLGIAILQKTSAGANQSDWRPGIREVLLEQLLFNAHFRFKTAKR